MNNPMNKYSLSLLTLSLFTLLLTTTSFANSADPYLGVQLGWGKINTPSTATLFTDSNTNGGLAYRILGGYDIMLNDHFHLEPEMGYTNYPDNSYNATLFQSNYHSSYWDVLANAKYYIVNGFQITGKLGVAYVTQKTLYSQPGNSSTPSTSKLLPEMGAAIGYDFNNMLGFDISYNQILGQTIASNDVGDSSKVAPITTIMLGINYTFQK